jgi:hypothetical protein
MSATKVRNSHNGMALLIVLTGVTVVVFVGIGVIITGSSHPAPEVQTLSHSGTLASLHRASDLQIVSNYDSDLGLNLTLFVNSTRVSQSNSTIVVVASLTNSLSRVNNVSASSDWPMPNLTLSSECGTYTLPYGIALMKGYYDQGNVSSGTTLAIFPPGNPNANASAAASDHCPVNVPRISGYIFMPASNRGTWGPSQPIIFNSTLVLHGYFTTNGQLASFTVGEYTLIRGDEWGQIVMAHFMVAEES